MCIQEVLLKGIQRSYLSKDIRFENDFGEVKATYTRSTGVKSLQVSDIKLTYQKSQ